MGTHKRILSLFLSFALVCGIFGADTAGAWAAQSLLTDGEISTNIFQDSTKYSDGTHQVKDSDGFHLSWDGINVGNQPAHLVLAFTGLRIQGVKGENDALTHWFKIEADKSTISSFRLSTCKIGMSPQSSFDITITGYLKNGETKTDTFTQSGSVASRSISFADEPITGFQIAYKNNNNVGFDNFALKTFTIASAGLDQAAPTSSTGHAPTVSGGNDGKITGTTNAMEYKLDGTANYTPVSGDEIDNLTAGTYRVRFAAKAGYHASPDTVVMVPDGGNRSQSAPTGLTGIAPTVYGGSDGKITGTTNAMEYKRDGAAHYTPVSGDEIDNLTAGTYRVRYAAKDGYNASSEIAVTVPDGANRSQSAPTGLTGHAPTVSGGSNGKITGTTSAMEYKLSTASNNYTPVMGTEIDNLTAGTYRVRYAAKPGYNASPDAAVTVPSGAQAPSGGGCPSTPSLPSTVSDAASNTTADLTGATFPAGVTNVTLTVTKPARGGKQAADFSAALLADAKSGVINIPEMCDMSLLDQNGTPASFTGSVTVRIPVPAGVRGTPHVFRYEADTKTFTDMNAKVEKGFLVFTTAHFSRYAVAGTGNAIVLDTLNYQMPIGGKYQIGLRLPRTKAASVKFYSTNSKTAAVTKMKNGNYQVDGKDVGTVWIMFDVYDGKNRFLAHASVRVDVKIGVRPRGDSTRQYAIF
jgi:hypothetical protein